MALLNTKEILIASADQSTTGAVLVGDVVSTVPADFAAAKTALSSLIPTGYLGEDGITIASSLSLSDFREMNRGIVRKGVDESSATITHNELQLMNEDVLRMKFGEDSVSVVAANATHGKQVRLKVGTELPPIRTFAYKLKDGDTRAIVWVPRGQVTNGIEITAAPNTMTSLPIEVSCYDDGTGGLFYIFFDDGQTTSSN